MINVLLILKKSKESTEKEDLGLLYNNSGGGGGRVFILVQPLLSSGRGRVFDPPNHLSIHSSSLPSENLFFQIVRKESLTNKKYIY